MVMKGTGYELDVTGTYTTKAYAVREYTTGYSDIDGFGTVRHTSTEGESLKWDPYKSEKYITGGYITDAYNDQFGIIYAEDPTAVILGTVPA